jgi:hypothetical protein
MHDYIKQLDENLRYIGEKSAQFQRELVARRLKDVDISKQNIYKEGDFVLRRDPAPLHKNKLAFRWAGPYVVIHDQKGNDVTCRNLVTDVVYVFYVGELKIFVATKEQATEAAMLDDDQFRVKWILSDKGDPATRTTMEFYVEWQNGDKLWVPWRRDIVETTVFETFCTVNRELQYLLIPASTVSRSIRQKNKLEIMLVEPGDEVYVNIRFYGHQWYELLNLPRWEFVRYVVKFKYGDWCNGSLGNPLYHRHINSSCAVLNETWPRMNHNFVSMWGSTKIFDKATMVLVDHQLLVKFPAISEDPNQRTKRGKTSLRSI